MELLLADDSPTIQKVMTLSFQKSSYRVTVVHSFAELKTQLATSPNPFRLLICDANLSGLDGAGELRAAVSRASDLKVLVLKGSYDPFDEEAFLEAGFSHILAKPFTVAQMLLRVQDLVPPKSRGAQSAVRSAASAMEGGSREESSRGGVHSVSAVGAHAAPPPPTHGSSWRSGPLEDLPHLPTHSSMGGGGEQSSTSGGSRSAATSDAAPEPYPGAQRVMKGAPSTSGAGTSGGVRREDGMQNAGASSLPLPTHKAPEKQRDHKSPPSHLSSMELDFVAAEVWSRLQGGITQEIEKGLEHLVSKGLERELRDLIRLELRSLADERSRL